MNTQHQFTIVIAGAGYAGIAAARALGKQPAVRVVLIDQHDYHLLQFQLHEAAVNKIEVDALALPLDQLLPRQVEFMQARINGFDFKQHTVKTDRDSVAYDRLIIALGSQPATYNVTGLDENGLMLKSMSDARRIRGHLEVTLSALKSQHRSIPYPILIGGAGITGVELAAELSEGLKHLTREYDLARDAIEIVLVEAAPNVLPGFDRRTVEEATAALKRLGVDVRTGFAVERVEADRVSLKAIGSNASESIETGTFIWTGGVQANSLVLNSGLSLGERGAAKVDEYLRSIDCADVSIVGDNAVVRDPRDGRVVMPCGQLAVKQGQYAAKQILAEFTGDVEQPYIPLMDGLLISLGSYAGVGTIGPVWVRRLIARLAKIGAETRYLFSLGGVKLVALHWLGLRHEWVSVLRTIRGLRGLTPHHKTLRPGKGTVK
ncbi:MAG TPA: NAD(P)/FAD-dependent oxidoreductase [Anaerolineae bacterium]